MNKFLDIVKSIFPKDIQKKMGDDSKRKKKDSDDEDEEDVGEVSMKDGDAGKIFGVNRNAVRGIAVFLSVLFLFAFVYGIGGDESQSKQEDGFQEASENDIAGKRKNNDGNVPDSYESLIAMNNKNKEAADAELKRQQELAEQQRKQQEAKNKETKTANVPAIPTPAPVPAKVTVPEPVQAPAPVQVVQTPTPAPEPEPANDALGSAIAFFGGENAPGKSEGEAGSEGQEASASEPSGPVYATKSGAENLRNALSIGTIIPVRLMTGINTSIDGHVTALILSDVYDYDGANLLIPRGSKVFGVYSSGKSAGGRVSIDFSTITTPQGISWNIGNALTAIDGQGYSGVKGRVHHHTMQKLGGGLIASGIAALGSLATGNVNTSANTYSAAQLAAQGAYASMIQSAANLFQQGANVENNTTVKPGYEFNLYVTQNIVFGPAR